MTEAGWPTTPNTFLALDPQEHSLERARVVLLPVPYDATTSYRGGAFSLTSYRYTWQTPDTLSITLEPPSGPYRAATGPVPRRGSGGMSVRRS